VSHLRAADGTVLCEHDEPHEIGTAPLRLAVSLTARIYIINANGTGAHALKLSGKERERPPELVTRRS
jgi:hypothetical protein